MSPTTGRGGNGPRTRDASGDGGLLAAERKVQSALGHMPLDFRAMGAISNLFRTSTAIRRHMESKVLAPYRLSWTSFVGLWVLWVWGPMEARAFAAAIGISRPTASGVMATLEGRGYVVRAKDRDDGRIVTVTLTARGRRTIEDLFPRFNAEESALASRLSRERQDELASTLRALLRAVVDGDDDAALPSEP
ncbi:MAG TPA: MarR family transcriptional regulator [Actinomycetota bacterium]|nr:MarR family transcriptional regulator [Actinomycetota bacterium]